MAVFNAAAWLANRTIRPTDDILEQVANYDPAFYGCGLDTILRHAHYFTLPFSTVTANNNTKTGLHFVARIPFKIVGVEHGCLSAAGSAATAGLEKAPAATPTVFATMQSALTDIKTNAPIMQAGQILDGSEDIAVGDRLRLSVVGTGAGDVLTPESIAHCFRL